MVFRGFTVRSPDDAKRATSTGGTVNMRFKELLPSRYGEPAERIEIDIPTNDVLKEIVNERRRCILLALEQQPSLSVRDVSRQIWECEQSRSDPPANRHSVYVSVKQNHVPRLVDTGLVISSDEHIQLTNRGESMVDIVELLDSVTREDGQV